MTTLTQRDILTQAAYYDDLRRAAQQHLRTEEALGRRRHSRRFVARSLAWFGRRLHAWGEALTQQYDAPPSLRPSIGPAGD